MSSQHILLPPEYKGDGDKAVCGVRLSGAHGRTAFTHPREMVGDGCEACYLRVLRSWQARQPDINPVPSMWPHWPWENPVTATPEVPLKPFEVCILYMDRPRFSNIVYDVRNELNRDHGNGEHLRFIVVSDAVHDNVYYLMFKTADLAEADRFRTLAVERYNKFYDAAKAQEKTT